MNSRIPVSFPSSRPLKVYAFDPSRGRTLGNYMTVNVDYEKLQPGPVGKHLAVIDYDASNKCYYDPVDLSEPAIMLRGGLDPSESDPRFHQQMVYAVSSETIRRFERALGRNIKWSFNKHGKRPAEERNQLRIFPHAFQQANAFYSRDLRALVFGYFSASEADAGANLPGQTIFTCLSHDIIAHETTHALVDSQRDYFTEWTSVDAPAFHEAFADIVALFQHFTMKEAMFDVVQRTGGNIFQTLVNPDKELGQDGGLIQAGLTTDNPLVGLAKQFGDAMGRRKALREALGTPPDSRNIQTLTEPHTRGSILVAAVFDAFFSVYIRRTRDLMRIARAGGANISSGYLPPELANRLCDTANKVAEQFLNICIRALDYCPPVDMRFGDFLRALITADYDVLPEDSMGYRAALIDAFRSRGIVPESVSSYSEESLLWCPPEDLHGAPLPPCDNLQFDVFKQAKGKPYRKQQESNARLLHDFAMRNKQWLGLVEGTPIQAHTFHEVHRVGPDGKLKFDVIAELTQTARVPLDPSNKKSGMLDFRGGSTVIFDHMGQVRYAIQKSLGDTNDPLNPRLQRQREFQEQMGANMAISAYAATVTAPAGDPFSLIHRGY